MVAYFANAVGVSHVRNVAHRLEAAPAYVTGQDAGAGFAELAEALLASNEKAVR
jgi:hypothetical protein